MKGKWVTPIAGFVIQTVVESSSISQVKDHTKVYINVCVHEDIDVPAMKTRLNDDGESVEGLNVPMSVGPRYEISLPGSNLDGSDNAIAHDIIVNDTVLKEATDDETGRYRDFICQLCIQYVESKLMQQFNNGKSTNQNIGPVNIVIDKRYNLPNLQYKGDAPSAQYIQDRKNMKMPVIQVIDEKSSNSKKISPKKDFLPKQTLEFPLAYEIVWVRGVFIILSFILSILLWPVISITCIFRKGRLVCPSSLVARRATPYNQ